MLSKQELEEIRNILERSQNPLFLFDNDGDGLSSFLILKKSLDRGKGFFIKSFPELDPAYLKKADEFNSDIVVVLDYGMISKDFIEAAQEKNLEVMAIDHHDVPKINEINFFTSYPTKEPTSYICQKVFNQKQTEWLALIGCISDVFLPEFHENITKEFPELTNGKKDPLDILFTTELGKIAMIMNFGLKDTTTNVMKLIRFTESCNSPQDFLSETKENKYWHEKYARSMNFIKKMAEKAKTHDNKIILEYSGETSMSSEISNFVLQQNRDKLIAVIYKKSGTCNVSLRGKKAKIILEKIIKELPNITGGGHAEACGARVPTDDLERFKEIFLKE